MSSPPCASIVILSEVAGLRFIRPAFAERPATKSKNPSYHDSELGAFS
jgi:hypothetical protein